MIDTIPPDAAPPEPAEGHPILRPEARIVRADRSLAAMVLVICTLGGMGVGFGFAMYLMRAQLAYSPLCVPRFYEGPKEPVTLLGVMPVTESATEIESVRAGAAAAGIRPGDVVNTGMETHDWSQVQRVVRAHQPGELVPVGIERDGRKIVLRARLTSL